MTRQQIFRFDGKTRYFMGSGFGSVAVNMLNIFGTSSCPHIYSVAGGDMCGGIVVYLHGTMDDAQCGGI